MLLAFIYNPLRTCVTYLALGLCTYILGTYLLICVIKHSVTSYKRLCNSHPIDPNLISFYTSQHYTENLESVDGNDIKSLHIICIYIFYKVYLFLGIGMVLVVYFSAAIIYVLTLGSLNDFELIQNLVPPLLIGVLTYFVVNQPTSKQNKKLILMMKVA